MKKILLRFCIGLCTVSRLIAQEDGGGEKREVAGRMACLVSANLPEGVETPLNIMTGQGVVQVAMSKRSASEPIKVPDDGILQIVREVKNPDTPEKSEYRSIGNIAVPEGVKKALIILMPAVENSNGLVFQPLVQDLDHLKGGSCLYVNMTQMQVAVDLDKTNIKINPGELKIYEATALKSPVSVTVRYSYYIQEKDQWKTLSDSSIAFYPTRREVCIFSLDAKSKRVDYHGITLP